MTKRSRRAACAPTVEEAERVLQSAYYDEIRALAEEAKGKGEEELEDWLHEMIDGHEFVIYTHKARMVMFLTDHPDAYEDETGEKAEKVEQEAYAAMMADVRDHL